MGLQTKPNLVFNKTSLCQKGAFDPISGDINFNENTLLLPGASKTSESMLRHELEHFLQNSDIVKLKGVDGLEQLMSEYYSGVMNELGDNPWAYESAGFSFDVAKNMTSGDRSVFNRAFWNDIAKNSSPIERGSAEAALAETYCSSMLEKVTPNPDAQKTFDVAVTNLKPEENIFDSIKYNKAKMTLYKANPLESAAYGAQEVYEKQVQNGRPGFLASIFQNLSLGLNSNGDK